MFSPRNAKVFFYCLSLVSSEAGCQATFLRDKNSVRIRIHCMAGVMPSFILACVMCNMTAESVCFQHLKECCYIFIKACIQKMRTFQQNIKRQIIIWYWSLSICLLTYLQHSLCNNQEIGSVSPMFCIGRIWLVSSYTTRSVYSGFQPVPRQ